MRKIIFIFGLCWMVATFAVQADNFTLANGGALAGDVLKFDGNGLMIRTADSTYTNVSWGQLSQDSLKQLAQNPKIAGYAEPFIEPSAPAHAAKPEITVKPVTRMERPAHPSVILGMLTSPVGLFVLFLIYAANLFAAYEIGLMRARTPAQMIGTAAILPIIAPIIFLWMPIREVKTVEAERAEAAAQRAEAPTPKIEIPVVEAVVPVEERKPEPQIFLRGKFTFNKRFVETKFAGFSGEPKGDALNFTMEVRTNKETFAVQRIQQVTPNEVVLETVPSGQATVLLADIQEVKLNPKPATT